MPGWPRSACTPRARLEAPQARLRDAAAPRAGGLGAPFSARWLGRRLHQLVGPLRGARFCVAYSGGSDSTALLAALAGLRSARHCTVRALHVNHHLQPGADAWADAALLLARRVGVPCRALDVAARAARGESPEAAARTARYGALCAALHPGEWLVLAQHQDDQAETLLLQLLRGAGVAGLASMPARSGVLLRPLLDVTREQLRAYVQRRALPWTEDPSNTELRFDRNYLRHQVLPLIQARWPSLRTTLGRTAALAAEAQALLSALADSQLTAAYDGAALRVAVLRRLNPAERHNGVRRWLDRRGLPMPDQRRLQEICGPLLRARHDAQPEVRWPGGCVRRHGARLHAEAEPAPLAVSAPTALRWRWLQERALPLPDGARLELHPDRHGDLLRTALPAEVVVRFREPDGSVGAARGGKRLKGLLQARAVPPWQRGQVPLLYAGRRLIAVADLWRAPELGAAARGDAVRGASDRLRLRWHAAGHVSGRT